MWTRLSALGMLLVLSLWLSVGVAGAPVLASAGCFSFCAVGPPYGGGSTQVPIGGGNGSGGADNNPGQTALSGADAGASNTVSDQPDSAGSGQGQGAQAITSGGQGQNCLMVGEQGCQEAELPCVYTASCALPAAPAGPVGGSGGGSGGAEGICVGGYDGYGHACALPGGGGGQPQRPAPPGGQPPLQGGQPGPQPGGNPPPGANPPSGAGHPPGGSAAPGGSASPGGGVPPGGSPPPGAAADPIPDPGLPAWRDQLICGGGIACPLLPAPAGAGPG